MSKWTKFRIIFECQNSEAQIREILGEPLPDNQDIEETEWDISLSRCHLAIGSEGSLTYELFKWHEKQMVLIFGNLRDYKPEEGLKWWAGIEPKFKYLIVDVCIIEET